MRGRLAPVALLLAAACTADPAPRAAPATSAAPAPASSAPASTVPAPTAAAPDVAPEPTVRVSVERTDAHVSSPTKNIGCYVSAEGLTCEIRARDWPLPPRPADCDADWGAGLSIEGAGVVTVGHCASDTVMGAPRILAYGTAVQVGAYRCTSLRAGMTCVHRPTGRGFLLSRARYRTF